MLRAVRPNDTAENIDRLVELRMQRQALLDQPQARFSFWAILDEAVLRRPVGGPTAMREQLLRLRPMAGRPNVTLQSCRSPEAPTPG